MRRLPRSARRRTRSPSPRANVLAREELADAPRGRRAPPRRVAPPRKLCRHARDDRVPLGGRHVRVQARVGEDHDAPLEQADEHENRPCVAASRTAAARGTAPSRIATPRVRRASRAGTARERRARRRSASAHSAPTPRIATTEVTGSRRSSPSPGARASATVTTSAVSDAPSANAFHTVSGYASDLPTTIVTTSTPCVLLERGDARLDRLLVGRGEVHTA